MAAKTTTAAGPFTTGATWVGGVAPSNGDTITVNHAVTWTPSAGSTFALGTGTGTAIAFGSNGVLTITGAGAFTLNLTGTVSGTNVKAKEFIVNSTNGTHTINFDATGAAGGFQILTAGAYDGGGGGGPQELTNPRGWTLNGNATYPVVVNSLPSDGSKNSYFGPTGNAGGGVVDASYTNFLRIGDATNAAFAPNFTSSRTFALTVNNCTFTSCGQYTVSPSSTYAATMAFTDNTWVTSVTNGTTSFPLNLSSSAIGTVTFTRCIWDKIIKTSNVKNVTWTNCYFADGWSGSHVTTPWTSMDGCLVRIVTADGGGGMIVPGSVTNSYIYYDKPAGTNPHFMAFEASLTAGTTVNVTGNIAYFNGTDAAGNIFLAAGSAANTVNIKNNLAMPNAGGSMSGALVTSDGTVANGFALNIEHNTAFVKGQHGLEIGHLYTSIETPNRYPSVKSNLFIGGNAGLSTDGYKAFNVDGSTTTDLIPPASIVKNGSYGIKLTSGTAGFTNEAAGYASKFSSAPGGTDIDGVNPNFVNSAATLATWAISQGSTNTGTAAEADALTYIKAALGTKVAALIAYHAAAYAPTNTTYRGAAHDGGDIGAFAVTSSGTYGPFLNFICGD